MSPRPISLTIAPTSRKATSRHSPLALSLKRTAGLSPYSSAAFSARSAIVFDPVDCLSVAAAVLASIWFLSLDAASRRSSAPLQRGL
jgi:hypothetical protein